MKKLPLALVVGLVLEVVFDSARAVHYLRMGADTNFELWDLFENGFDFACEVLVAVGLFQLASGLRGRQQLGARIAGWAYIAQLVLLFAWFSIGAAYLVWHPQFDMMRHIELASRYVSSLTVLAVSIGMLVATRKLGLGIAAIAISVIGVPVPVLGKAIGTALSLGQTGGMLFTMLPYALVSLVWLVMAARAADPIEMPPPAISADAAFSTAARSIWLRVVAACSVMAVTLFAAVSGEAGMLSLLKGVTVLSPMIDFIALTLFACAMWRLARAGISPGVTIAAATCALIAAGATLQRLPKTYEMLFGDHSSFRAEDSATALKVFSIVVPLLGVAALVLAAIAVARLARERNAEDVRENVAVRTGVFVVLTLGSLFVTLYGAEHLPNSRGVVMFVLLLLVCATFYSLVLIAKICATGAELVARDPVGLPTAKVVQ